VGFSERFSDLTGDGILWPNKVAEYLLLDVLGFSFQKAKFTPAAA